MAQASSEWNRVEGGGGACGRGPFGSGWPPRNVSDLQAGKAKELRYTDEERKAQEELRKRRATGSAIPGGRGRALHPSRSIPERSEGTPPGPPVTPHSPTPESGGSEVPPIQWTLIMSELSLLS